MSIPKKKIVWIPLVVVIAFAITALVLARPRSPRPPSPPPASLTSTQNERGARVESRNLAMRPEAFNLSRRLGKRFSPAKLRNSVLVGTLKAGSEQRTVQIVRGQTDDGEAVEVRVAGSGRTLRWSRGEGSHSSSGRANGDDRDLIERLVFDSPDQFVLAQLRGASYYTIAHHVRPTDAPDSYTGPTWTLVRVVDPEADSDRKPRSSWRLYYLNTVTGLVDKIVTEVAGQRIVAEFSGWTELQGEKVPAEITWTRDGQTIMEFRLTNFSHN